MIMTSKAMTKKKEDAAGGGDFLGQGVFGHGDRPLETGF